MKQTLFEINERMNVLLEYNVDSETGELMQTQEEFDALYDSIEVDMETKIDNSNCLIKSIDGDIGLIDNEIKRLQTLKKQKTTIKERIFNNIDRHIKMTYTKEDGTIDYDKLGKHKSTLAHSQISYRKSSSVDILDATKIPKKFINVTKVEKPIKKDIKAFLQETLKNGKPRKVTWATINTKYGMQVK